MNSTDRDSRMNGKERIGSRVIHAGSCPYDGALSTGPVVQPIHMGSTFEFTTVQDYMDCITGESPYPMYTRGTSSNPTIRLLQSQQGHGTKNYSGANLDHHHDDGQGDDAPGIFLAFTIDYIELVLVAPPIQVFYMHPSTPYFSQKNQSQKWIGNKPYHYL